MNSSNDITNALPRRHPKEPRELRQDIADEIADHMHEATRRELQRGAADEAAAYEQAVATFGDPNAVARRLWWDAMKEIIMREWIQTGILGVMAVCVIGFMGVTYNAMRNQNSALLGVLKNGQNSQTRPFEFRVTRGAKDGDPVDAQISVSGNAIRLDDSVHLSYKTDVDGVATTEPLLLGSYQLQVLDPVSGFTFIERETPLFPGDGPVVLEFATPSLDEHTVAFTGRVPLNRVWERGYFIKVEIALWTEQYFWKTISVIGCEQGFAAFENWEVPAKPWAEDITWESTVTFTGGSHILVGGILAITEGQNNQPSLRDEDANNWVASIQSYRSGGYGKDFYKERLVKLSDDGTTTVELPITLSLLPESPL